MKSLKLEHHLAQLIIAGEKTSTWRLYDDKDLSVNDDIRLIDKVVPDKPETWKVIGVAHINTVIQKRLGDITADDFEGHEKFASKGTMLKTYQSYYGSRVNYETPVKIIHFTFNNVTDQQDVVDVNNSSILTEVKLFSDGGSRGNPGPSACGFAVQDMHGNLVVKKGIYIGVTTNNQAEYQGLKLGLEEVLRMRVKVVHVYMDSLLVVNQMNGTFKIKNRDLWPIHSTIKELTMLFDKVTFAHLPRELNKIADSAVNEALDQAQTEQA